MESKSHRKTFHFVGIGGSGMNGIARIMNHHHHLVSGSDRDHDNGNRPDFYADLLKMGIAIHPQDGSGIRENIDCVVTSTAVESQIPDIVAARRLNIPIIHRSEALHQLVSPLTSVAVAGTSGKSTVTGMAGWCLNHSGRDPMMINGAKVIDLPGPGKASDILSGQSVAVFEADESDGSLVRFKPSIGILTNITLDHMPMDKLRTVFTKFAQSITDTLIYNADCPEASSIGTNSCQNLSFGLSEASTFQATDLSYHGLQSTFYVEKKRINLAVPGRHNIENALAVYALLRHLGTPSGQCAELLSTFKGIHRRFQVMGVADGITVVDDFAHNPDKLRATIDVADTLKGPITFVFQPHGFGPTRFLFNELAEVFSRKIQKPDRLILTPVFYAGGTVNRDVSSLELAARINQMGGNAEVLPRNLIPESLARTDAGHIIVMGARDPSLPGFCQTILQQIRNCA